ncbi:hypothetical protein CWR52_23240 [Enterobacter sp. SGAir0187]|nr:hypothetical protein CWR52_00145 [Enterobacter sp. SGAir0187]AVH19910.1 hypothetical protein CWR52_23240 [Enterobacter sp. SGAir0187]
MAEVYLLLSYPLSRIGARFHAAVKRAGIRRRNPYHTRHTIFAPAGSEGSTQCKRIKRLTKKSNTILISYADFPNPLISFILSFNSISYSIITSP